MQNLTGAIRRTIPIGVFNRGGAGQVFADVRKSGSKVVLKNNAAECVLMSPEEYVSIMDELEDARLFEMAISRETVGSARTFSEEEIMSEFGITDEDLSNVEVDLE